MFVRFHIRDTAPSADTTGGDGEESVRRDYPTATANAAARAAGSQVNFKPVPRPTVLVYSPRESDGLDYQPALEAAGYRVVRSTTVAGCSAHLDGEADVVVLDDPPWELARSLVATLDAAPLPVPRLWVSSWSMAPAMAGRLGIDALLLERDVLEVVEQVHRACGSRRHARDDQAPARRPIIRRATTVSELHPHTPGVDD